MPTCNSVSWVGPVVQATPEGLVVVEALRAANPDLQITDRGSYLRALAPGRCVLRLADLRRLAGEELNFPQDLEAVLSSFQGRMKIEEGVVTWYE